MSEGASAEQIRGRLMAHSQAASAHVSSTDAEDKADSSDSPDSDVDESKYKKHEVGSYEQLLFFRHLKASCRPGEFGADWPLQELEKKYRGRSEPAS